MDFQFVPGRLPLLVSMPHVGTDIPDEIAARLTNAALQKPDTDWHLPQLYNFLQEMGASTLAARWSRYVIDLNRPAQDTNLYPGQDTTGLTPLDTFHKDPLYLEGQAPSSGEVAERLQRYWQPYHTQIQTELARLVAEHGYALLWDAHSIASVVPRFFEGKLPDLNFGTADGSSCALGMTQAVVAVAQAQSQYSVALNGRFKGGYITRQYGQSNPSGLRVHAIQLEMCQSVYMQEEYPFAYRPELAQQVQPLLQQMFVAMLDWAKKQA